MPRLRFTHRGWSNVLPLLEFLPLSLVPLSTITTANYYNCRIIQRMKPALTKGVAQTPIAVSRRGWALLSRSTLQCPALSEIHAVLLAANPSSCFSKPTMAFEEPLVDPESGNNLEWSSSWCGGSRALLLMSAALSHTQRVLSMASLTSSCRQHSPCCTLIHSLPSSGWALLTHKEVNNNKSRFWKPKTKNQKH